MGEASICSFKPSKVCGRCGITKPIDEFYKIVAKDEKTERIDRVCKSCKGELKKARRSRTALEKSIGDDSPVNMNCLSPICEQSTLPADIQNPEKSVSIKSAEELPEPVKKQKYTHPNYEDGEVRQAIEVFQILQKKRDEARKKGLINW